MSRAKLAQYTVACGETVFSFLRAGPDTLGFETRERLEGGDIGFRTGHGRVLRNELGCAGDGSKAEAFEFTVHGDFVRLFLATGVFAHCFAELLQLRERFIETALGGGAVAERESEKGLVDVGVSKASSSSDRARSSRHWLSAIWWRSMRSV